MTEHQGRDGAARPRLDLPRFEFGAAASAFRTPAAPQPHAPVQAAPRGLTPTPFGAPMATQPQSQSHFRAPTAPQTFVAPTHGHAPSGYAPVAPSTPQPHYAAPVQHQTYVAPQHHALVAHAPYMHGAAAPAHVAAPPAPSPQHAVVPAHALAPTPAPAMARTSSISWERLEQPEEERTFLQKITPMHMGFLLIGIVLLMIISSKPGAVRTAATALPEVVDGSGVAAMPVQPRPAIAATGVSDAAPRTVKMIKIGSGSLPVTAQHGGIPTAAASVAMSKGVLGGGGPSVNDGVTLPRSTGERDAPTREVKTGGGGAAETPPATPVMTPGASAQQAEARHLDSTIDDVQRAITPLGVS